MISPANPACSAKNDWSSRPAGMATTSARENADPMTSSASWVVAIGGPSSAQSRTGTPRRSITMSLMVVSIPWSATHHVVPGSEDLVEGPEDIGRGRDVAQDDDLE